jgi:DNA-binding transcriptional ArsR family regulator
MHHKRIWPHRTESVSRPDRGRERVTPTSTERAVSHPRRIAILDHLADVDFMSDRQIAQVLGLTHPAAAYHLRVLSDADMVKREGYLPKNGTVQHLYAAKTQ